MYIYIIILLLILLILLSLIINENFFDYTHKYLFHKSKCFDCEKEIINKCGVDNAWRANPAKIFADEYGMKDSDGFIAKSMKFY